jgi:serine/threonine protein kinase
MSSELPEPGPRRYGRIGKYEIVSHIATGGVAAVYRALDTDLGREVALKVLKPEWNEKPNILERFRREARHCAKLRHENVVSIYEFGEANGNYYLALEFIDGIDLHEYINRKGRLHPHKARVITIQAIRALDHLHKLGMVHRDIKPSNFLIASKKGRKIVKLADLGLARVVRDDEFRVTKAGFTVGTIDYMSPEQARDSGAVDIRSDIYSMGCTLYHMLAGEPPFSEGGLAERLYKHLEADPPDIREVNPAVPAGLSRILRKMLAKKPADRYQTPRKLLRALLRLEEEAELPVEDPEAPSGILEAPPPPPESAPPPSALPVPEDPSQTTPALSGRETTQDLAHDPSDLLGISQEHRQAAAGQFERAEEVIAAGNYDYGIHLLLSCCKLDPARVVYRRVLRRAEREKWGNNQHGSRLAFLTTSATRTKLKAAKAAQDYLKVLELGEEILTRNPWDTATQTDMAEAAEGLGLLDLAIWLLELAVQKDHPDVYVARYLARLYERRGKLTDAIRLWEVVRGADPNDLEAFRKTRDLAARQTIGEYKEAKAKRRRGTNSD